MEKIMFTNDNFLKQKIKNLVLDKSQSAVVNERTILKETLEKMVFFKIGIACVVNKNNILQGVITDGDLRRKLLTNQKPWSALLNDDSIDHCKNKPITIRENESLKKTIDIFRKKKVWDLPVLDKKGKLLGILHLQTILSIIMKNN
jgi:arabinose-5-phosphate isomerase